MTTSSGSGSRPRIRPITAAIGAWVLIMVAAIVGAWQGTEARFGEVPTLHASTTEVSVEVPPYVATDLDGNEYQNPIPEVPLAADGFLSIRVPSDLARVPYWVFEIRDGEQYERFVAAGEGGTHALVDATTRNGRLEAVSIRAQTPAFDAEGNETAFNAEWAVDIAQVGPPVPWQDVPMHGEPSVPWVAPTNESAEAPDDALHSGVGGGE